MLLAGTAAIVTGGASGLGEATAAMLAQAGARVTILDLATETGETAAHRIGGLFIRTDVTDDASVAAALASAQSAHGIARVLVNCAGVAPAHKTVGRGNIAHALADFRRAIDINLVGTFNVLSKFAALLCAAEPVGEERGVIVNTASVAAQDGQIGQAAYAASKGGIVAMTLPIARELAQHAIRVMTVAPGLFMTPLLAGLPAAVQQSLGKQAPFPSRLGHAEEFAHLVASIIANPMLNGETIRIDGAIRMTAR